MVTVRYFAGARAAAGVGEEAYDAADAPDLAALLAAVLRARGEAGAPLARVLDVCSLLVDGDPVGRRPHDAVALRDCAVVEVLPPFAGG